MWHLAQHSLRPPVGLPDFSARFTGYPCGKAKPGLPDGLAPSEAEVCGLASEPNSPVRGEPVEAAVRDCSGGVDAADCDVRVRRVNCVWFIEEILRLVPCRRVLDD